MRAVLDANVLIAALLSPAGAPAQLLSRWLAGEFELVASDRLLAELKRALGYPKLRDRISPAAAAEFVSVLSEAARVVRNPQVGTVRSPDPGDDYLLALAQKEQAVLVSGDEHLLGLASSVPVRSPRGFLDLLESEAGGA